MTRTVHTTPLVSEIHAKLFERALCKADSHKEVDRLVDLHVDFIQYRDKERCQRLLANQLARIASEEKQ